MPAISIIAAQTCVVVAADLAGDFDFLGGSSGAFPFVFGGRAGLEVLVDLGVPGVAGLAPLAGVW